MNHFFKLFLLSITLLASSNAFAQTIKAVDNSLNAGKVEWIDRQINTGTVPFGQPVTVEYQVKNISNENLLILQVKSACHCVVTEWPRSPIEPGRTATINVTYDGKKEGDFYKLVSVITNFDSMQSIPLALIGKVGKGTEASINN